MLNTEKFPPIGFQILANLLISFITANIIILCIPCFLHCNYFDFLPAHGKQIAVMVVMSIMVT